MQSPIKFIASVFQWGFTLLVLQPRVLALPVRAEMKSTTFDSGQNGTSPI